MKKKCTQNRNLSLLGGRKSFNLLKLLSVFLLLIPATQILAEGTKQVSPTENDWAILTLIRGFAGYGTSGTDRALCLDILDTDEEVYIALSQLAYGDHRDISTSAYEFRIVDSVRNIVHGPFSVNPSNSNGNNYADVVSGPDLGSGTGYDISDPIFHFSPPYKGRFCIEFKLTAPIASSGFQNQGPIWWDFTVTDAGGNPQLGRLFSKNWSLRTTCDACSDIFSQPFMGNIFVLTDDGFVHKIDFENSGFRGLTFDLAFNRQGPGNTGDYLEDRRSVNGINSNNPSFDVFLNDPDPALYVEPMIGAILNDPIFRNPGKCDTIDTFCFDIEISQPGSVEMILDFEAADSSYTPGSADLVLGKVLLENSGKSVVCFDWNGKDGLGNSVDLESTIPTIVNYTQGEIHFMMYDVEYNTPGYTIEVIHPATAIQFNKIYYDDSNLASADRDANLDADNNSLTGSNPPLIELNGCNTPCHTWSRNTSSQNLGFGESNTINSWWQGNLKIVNLSFGSFCAATAVDSIVVEKTVTSIVNSGSTESENYDVSFEILIENVGASTLNQLQLTDDMADNFGAGYIGLVQGPVFSTHAGTPEMPNPSSSFGTEIFNGTSGELKPGDILKVSFTVELNPMHTGSLEIMSNQAMASAENTNAGTTASDLSDDSLDLTSDNDPTLISFPKIGLAKRITSLPAPAAASGEPFSYDLTYEFLIENIGDTPLTNISLKDSLTTYLNSAFTKLVGTPSVVPSATTAISPGGVNPNFSGSFPNDDLLDGTGVLNPGEKLVVQITAEIEPHKSGVILTPEGYLENSATVFALNDGIAVTDISDTGSDASDDNAPSGSNPGTDGDTGGSDDRTLYPVPIVAEICNNNRDDDGDGMEDCADNDCGFSVTISGDCSRFSVDSPQVDWTFQWYKNGNPISGATASIYTPVSINEPGDFSVFVQNSSGCQSESLKKNCCNSPVVLILGK